MTKENMTMTEIVKSYNSYADKINEAMKMDYTHVNRFSTKEVGIKRLNALIDFYKENVEVVKEEKTKAKTRKEQVLEILKQGGLITTRGISEKLGISRRNVSSILTYLRNDGHNIETEKKGTECNVYLK